MTLDSLNLDNSKYLQNWTYSIKKSVGVRREGGGGGGGGAFNVLYNAHTKCLAHNEGGILSFILPLNLPKFTPLEPSEYISLQAKSGCKTVRGVIAY